MFVGQAWGLVLNWSKALEVDMQEMFKLTVKPSEFYYVKLLEVCSPRFRGDNETHRVQLTNGNILRVFPSQLRPAFPSQIRLA